MAKHTYQLVFQFACTTQAKYTDLIQLMQQVEEAIGHRTDVFVDGYDHGLGEFNIFIHTDEALELFEDVGEIIGALRPNTSFAAGYRAFGDYTYTSLYPRSSTTFTVS